MNVAEAVTVKNDCLRKELISDGIHLHTAECVEWREYLKAHPVEKGSDKRLFIDFFDRFWRRSSCTIAENKAVA